MKEKILEIRDRYGAVLSPIVFFISLLLLDLGFRLYHQSVGETAVWNWVPNTFTVLWLLILTGVVLLIPGLAKKIVMGVLVGFFTLLVLAHTVLYHVSGAFISFSDLAFAEGVTSFLSVQYFTFSWKMYLLFFVVLLLGAVAVLLAPRKQNFSRIATLVCACVIFFLAFGIYLVHEHCYHDGSTAQFAWTDTYKPDSPEAIYTEFSDSLENVLLCGNYQYLYRSITLSFTERFHYAEMKQSLDRYFLSRPETKESNEMSSVLENENFIAIMMESIDTWMINEDMMPNLWALQQKSQNFTEFYTPLYLSGGTFNTEFAFNIGYFLPSTGTSARTYATNVYPQSLPNLFRAKGYTANSYHALDGRFYNREYVHPLWGYETFNDHGALDLQANHDLDTTMMEAYDKFCPSDSEKPFFSYIITYSGHGPYNDPESPIASAHYARAVSAAENSGIQTENEDTWDQFVIAIAHAMETDAFIGALVEQMESDSSLDNTALLLFGDHYCKYLTDTEFIHQIKSATDGNDVCKTPMMIYSKKLSPANVDKISSTIDLLPTIANLFGLPIDHRFVVGNDLYSADGGFVCFKDYSWIDRECYYNPDHNTLTNDHIKSRNKQVKELLSVCWNTVKCNYFGKQ